MPYIYTESVQRAAEYIDNLISRQQLFVCLIITTLCVHAHIGPQKQMYQSHNKDIWDANKLAGGYTVYIGPWALYSYWPGY